jgi:hypothetical protein
LPSPRGGPERQGRCRHYIAPSTRASNYNAAARPHTPCFAAPARLNKRLREHRGYAAAAGARRQPAGTLHVLPRTEAERWHWVHGRPPPPHLAVPPEPPPEAPHRQERASSAGLPSTATPAVLVVAQKEGGGPAAFSLASGFSGEADGAAADDDRGSAAALLRRAAEPDDRAGAPALQLRQPAGAAAGHHRPPHGPGGVRAVLARRRDAAAASRPEPSASAAAGGAGDGRGEAAEAAGRAGEVRRGPQDASPDHRGRPRRGDARGLRVRRLPGCSGDDGACGQGRHGDVRPRQRTRRTVAVAVSVAADASAAAPQPGLGAGRHQLPEVPMQEAAVSMHGSRCGWQGGRLRCRRIEDREALPNPCFLRYVTYVYMLLSRLTTHDMPCVFS